jgi:hypothetical protein
MRITLCFIKNKKETHMAKRLLCLAAVVLFASAVFAQNSFTGTYKMDNGEMKLVQKGNKVTGSYKGKDTGKIEGTVANGRLKYRWVQPNGEKGRGYFNLSPDGKSIFGLWGNGESETNGGEWKGVRIK